MKQLKANIFPIACLSAFVMIAYLITRGATMNFDTVIQSAVFSMRNEPLTSFFTFLTHTGDWYVVTALCVSLIFSRSTRHTFGIPLSVTAVCGTTLYGILKYIFQRPRPDAALHLITEGGFSFPSGHSMNIMLVYGLLILLLYHHNKGNHRKIILTASILISIYIFLIGFSRIYVGVHYPTDVLGGWLLSLSILWLARPMVFQMNLK